MRPLTGRAGVAGPAHGRWGAVAGPAAYSGAGRYVPVWVTLAMARILFTASSAATLYDSASVG